MAYLPLRAVALPRRPSGLFDAWLDDLDGRLSAPGADWHRITRDVLFGMWYPGLQRLRRPGGGPGDTPRHARVAPGPRPS